MGLRFEEGNSGGTEEAERALWVAASFPTVFWACDVFTNMKDKIRNIPTKESSIRLILPFSNTVTISPSLLDEQEVD